MQNWDIALEELNRLREIIDSKNFQSPLNQLQSRIWLMHWTTGASSYFSITIVAEV
ncbi:Eukaryotic translation initiation factor 3 subunit e, partial [Thalictrum thalictroides]